MTAERSALHPPAKQSSISEKWSMMVFIFASSCPNSGFSNDCNVPGLPAYAMNCHGGLKKDLDRKWDRAGEGNGFYVHYWPEL